VRHAYPLMLDVSNRLVVIVGGGSVAARKATGLLDAGATRVRVVSLTFCESMPSGIERVTARYVPDHLDGAALVFAATDDESVNAAVVRDAHQRNLLANRADADEQTPGDFTAPAIIRDGELTITVSTAGSPALAAAIRDRLKSHVQPKWVKMAQVAQIYRPDLIQRRTPPDVRRAVFRDLATEEAMNLLDTRGADALAHWLKDRHPGL